MSSHESGTKSRTPERRPLRVPTGAIVEHEGKRLYQDGFKVVKPGEPGYDEAYAVAHDNHRFGHAMPYADEAPRTK